jgi:enoyl-CoA hydratase
MAYSQLRYEVDARGVATITMDQPDNRNALTDEMLDDLLAAFAAAKADDAVRVAVLTSSHDKVFSSGGNLAGFTAERPIVHKYQGMDRFPRLFDLIGGLGKPVICAANGHVLAGAFGIALACDLIVAKASARFGAPEVNIGAFPFMISVLILRNVPRKKALELMMLGDQISAEQGAELGFVNRVVPDGEFDEAVSDWAGRLAAKGPLLMKLGKDAVHEMQDMTFDQGLQFLRAQLSLAFTTEDMHEGVKAFFDKREPEWRNR